MAESNPITPTGSYNEIGIDYIVPKTAAFPIEIKTANAGTTYAKLDGANLQVKFDTIAELTAANGVSVDGAILKDGALTQLNNVFLKIRNAANNASYDIVKVDASNALAFGTVLAFAQTWTPTVTCSGSMTYTSQTINHATYWEFFDRIRITFDITGTIGGTPSTDILITLPVNAHTDVFGGSVVTNNGTQDGGTIARQSATQAYIRLPASANWTAGASRRFFGSLEYRRA